MAHQAKLFDGELCYRPVWELDGRGVKTAAQIVIDLLEEGRVPVMEFDIAKRKLELGLEPVIPEVLADDFSTIVDQIHDQRYRIKAKVEELSDYQLVIVDEEGQTARRSRRACGFDIRGSGAGRDDDSVQLTLNLGGIRAAIKRHPELVGGDAVVGHISNVLSPIREQLLRVAKDTDESPVE